MMKKLGAKNPENEMDENTMGIIHNTLFPTHEMTGKPAVEG